MDEKDGIIEYNQTIDEEEEEEDDEIEKTVVSKRGCWHYFTLDLRTNIRDLRKSPRDLLVLYVIVFLDSLAYFAFSYALIMHLSVEVGLPDAEAGLFYGIFGVVISISTLVLGFVADWLGVRMSILISAFTGIVTHIGMAYAVLARNHWTSALVLFIGVAPSMALMGPAIPTAVKRYTTSRTSTFAFSVYYGIMNLAAFAATPAVDMIRLHIHVNVLFLPPYAMLIAITGLLQIPIFVMAFVWVRNVNLSDNGTMTEFDAASERVKRGDASLGAQIESIFRNTNFWRAAVLALSLIGVKSTFRYFDALYLPYVLRAFENATTFPYLTLLVINPAIVISLTLTGVVTLFTNLFHPVTSIIIGSFFGGIAPIFMALGPYMTAIILWIVCTSVGEVIWSPVSYAYLVSLTDDGQEGAWMALAGMPMFMAKLLTGLLTGNLLGKFCPDPLDALENATVNGISPPQLGGDPETCWSFALWGIITITTMSSFVLLLATCKFTRSAAIGTRSTEESKPGYAFDSDDDAGMIAMQDGGALVVRDLAAESDESQASVDDFQ